MKRLHMTGSEVGVVISVFNNMVKKGLLTVDMLPHNDAKAVFYKVQAVANENEWTLVYTSGGDF